MTDQHQPVDNEYADEVNAFRQEKDRFFATAHQSPIPREERGDKFGGLNYYPPDPAYRVVAEVTPFEHPDVIEMATSTGDIRPQLRYAELRFHIGDQELRLVGFTDPDVSHTHELFVPFRDATSGHDTYGAGRYLEVAVERDETGTPAAIIGFNNICYSNFLYGCKKIIAYISFFGFKFCSARKAEYGFIIWHNLCKWY